MERIIRWFVNNTVAANMLMLFIMVAGVMTLPRMKMEVFPDINLDIVSISVIYPGASPESVEESICLKLEEKLTGLKGVKRISSTASENVGTTLVEILPGEDINEIKDNVQTKIDAIDSFPTDAEKPVVQTISLSTEVVTVAVYGNVEEESLNFFADEVKSEIDALDEVSLTSISGKKDREISIEISKNNLQKYRLTMDQIASAIRANSMDMPGGGIDTDIGEILIRSKGQAYNQEEFESIPIVSRIDGSNLLLGDIATIKDGFADVEVYTKFNDQPAMYISVFRIGDQNSLNVSAAVKDYVKQKSLELPDGINLTLWNDEAELLQARIDLLTENGLLGLALVIIVLALFLKTNLAGWVSLGIPISFLGGFMLMPIVDVSINMLSLFTFILVLGIVVDDAIVVCVRFRIACNLFKVQNAIGIAIRFAFIRHTVRAHVREWVSWDPSEVVLQNAIRKIAGVGASILVAVFFRPIADLAGIGNAVLVAVFLSIVDLDRISDAIVVTVVFA